MSVLLKHLSHLLKDYGEANCSGACANPIKHDKDTDLSEPLHEFETRIKDREFIDVGISFDVEFCWFDIKNSINDPIINPYVL